MERKKKKKGREERRKTKGVATWQEEQGGRGGKKSWKCCVRFPLSSPRTVKRLTEGCNEAQGSGVNMFDTLTLTQPAVETSRCPHTLALISHTHTHTHTGEKTHSSILRARGGERNRRKIRRVVETEGKMKEINV